MSEAIRDTRALTLIEQLAFRPAFRHPKGNRPYFPHEFTVRDKQDPARETAYVQLFHLIQVDRVIERWRGRKTRFLYPGDGYKYWAMTTSEPASRVINRMRIEDTARPRREWQVDHQSA